MTWRLNQRETHIGPTYQDAKSASASPALPSSPFLLPLSLSLSLSRPSLIGQAGRRWAGGRWGEEVRRPAGDAAAAMWWRRHLVQIELV
jgi:hypothetical protein